MENFQVIQDNFRATNNSFLQYLHEQDLFDIKQFDVLCEAIASLNFKENSKIAYKIHFIYAQIVKHIMYNFDPNDTSCICNLPTDYVDQINRLDDAISKFFN